MSRISQGFINDVACLYEEINIQQNDFLNEESEYYDQETSEMVEDILSTISVSMIYEGYSAEGIIGFLADSSEETIIEKYLSFDESILVESTISEEYVAEQLAIFDVAIDEGIGSLIGKVAKGALSFAGRVASKPARAKVAQKMMKSKDPAKTAAAVDRLARMKLNKAGAPSDITKKLVDAAPNVATKTRIAATAPAVGKIIKGVQKVKDIAKSAKSTLTSPTAKKVGLGALGLGAMVGSGAIGAKLAGAGSDKSGAPKPTPSSATNNDFLKGSSLAKLGGREGRIKGGEFRTMKWSPESRARYASATAGSAKPAPSAPSGGGGVRATASSGGTSTKAKTPEGAKQTGDKAKDMEAWAKANPSLAAKVKPGQSGYGVISGLRDKPSSHEKQDQTPTQGSPTAQIDTKSVEADIKAEQERLKKKLEQQNKSTTTAKESYEPYDIILEYLIGRGHADTIEEANYIMLEMDQNAIGIIMQEYNDYLLAEEVSEWVDGLLEEGYDLSDYTWDDIVEYYVSEAKQEKYEISKLPSSIKDDPKTVKTIKRAFRSNRRNKPEQLTGRQRILKHKLDNLKDVNNDSEENIRGSRRGAESPTDR